MKNRMPLKKTLGKISRFLRAQRHSRKGQSDNRKGVRIATGAQSKMPSSTKVGAGDSYRLRAKGQIRIKH